LRSPDLTQRFDQFSGIPTPSTGAEFSTYLKSEMNRWAPVIRKGNIVLE